MKNPTAAVRENGLSPLDMLFAGGSTAVFLTIVASLIGAISSYIR